MNLVVGTNLQLQTIPSKNSLKVQYLFPYSEHEKLMESSVLEVIMMVYLNDHMYLKGIIEQIFKIYELLKFWLHFMVVMAFLYFHSFPCLVMSCLVMPCIALPFHAMNFLAFPFHAMPCLTLPSLDMPCISFPFHALPCHAMPCHALPCLSLPCHAMPCHAH
jgi:hypothetical protein